MNAQGWLGLVVVLLASCAAEPLPAPHGKPQAPVNLRVDSVDRGGQRFEIRVSATPTQEVDSVQVSLLLPAGVSCEEGDKPVVVFAATAAGTTRTLVRHLRLSVPGADVVIDARVAVAGGTRNRAQVLRVGTAKPVQAPTPVNQVVLPSGEIVDEVRP